MSVSGHAYVVRCALLHKYVYVVVLLQVSLFTAFFPFYFQERIRITQSLPITK